MKQRLLSLALAFCLLAALLPAGVLNAHAVDKGTFTIYVSVTSPGEGGEVRSIVYSYTNKFDNIYYTSPTYTYGFNYTWSGIDENGVAFTVENVSLKDSRIRPLPGTSCSLDVALSSPGVWTGTSMVYPAQWNNTIRRSQISTDDKGEKKVIDGDYDWYDGASALHVKYTFSPVCCPIETVDLAMSPPVAGQPVDFSAVSYRPEELAVSESSENFHLHGVRWTDKTDGLAVTGGTFKVGHIYEANVYVEAADAYHYFRKDGPATATINGFPAQITDVSEDHSRYEITYSFPTSYVRVTGVTLNKTSLTLAAGFSETLTATVKPSNAAAKGVVWISSDHSVAVVDDNGRVTATGEGTATITVTTKDGGKTASCLVTVTAPVEYGLEIAGVQVTSLNRRDVLRNGAFSFDGDHTLTVKKDYRTDKRLIYNRGIEGLVIKVNSFTILRSTGAEALVASKNTTVTGPGELSLRSSDDCGVYVPNYAATLTIADTTVDVSGKWGIAGPSNANSTKLVIDHASVTAEGSSGAVCDFDGGITLRHCTLVQPEGGTISGGDIADASGLAAEVQITADTLVNPFVDVKAGKWYYDPVLWAYYHDPQITTGTDKTHFSPDRACTRGQIVTFLWRAYGCPEPTITAHPFSDVRSDAFYYKDMLWAVEKGITSGTSDTTFSPSQSCTRGQVVTFLWRAAGSPEPESTVCPFTDLNPTASYYKAVLWAVEKGITSGTSDTTFSPSQSCTRGHVVTFLYRYMVG